MANTPRLSSVPNRPRLMRCKRSVSEVHWDSCNVDENADHNGHATKAMIRKYAGAARQQISARRAQHKCR